MKSKSILQMKPALVAVTLLVTFLFAGTAAADVQMISTHTLMDYLTDEVKFLFKSVVTIMIIVGSTLIAFGDSKYKARGIVIVSACILAVIAYYVVPYLIHDLETISNASNNTTST